MKRAHELLISSLATLQLGEKLELPWRKSELHEHRETMRDLHLFDEDDESFFYAMETAVDDGLAEFEPEFE